MKPANKLTIESLGKEWQDKDYVLLHACFQILKDFVEQEVSEGIVDWNHADDIREVKKEIDFLCDWWRARVAKDLEPEFDPVWEKKHFEEDTEMLTRLIEIRGYLWT